jgi:hypothetical protein
MPPEESVVMRPFLIVLAVVSLIVGYKLLGPPSTDSPPSPSHRELGTPQQAPTATNWRVIGEFIDGEKTKFVEIKAEHAKDRVEYDNAVNTLCHEISFCTIAFFLPGDRVPANQSEKDFFAAGGWNNYPALAFWLGNRASGSFLYTKWDCDRAGADGAPGSALCGPGVSEAFSAVLALSSRAGTAEACGWPKNDDAKLTLGYINNIKNLRVRRNSERVTTCFTRRQKKGQKIGLAARACAQNSKRPQRLLDRRLASEPILARPWLT